MTLERLLHHALNIGHQRAWYTFESVRATPEAYGLTRAKVNKWKTPGEPAFVSKLLDGLLVSEWLSDELQEYLGPLGLSDGTPLISGVFMHQKPKVKFLRCHVELADLLFVRHHFVVSKDAVDVQARAFLLQAKAGPIPSTGTLTGKEAEQFKLYSNWKTPLSFPHGELGRPDDGGDKWNLGQGPMPYPEQSGVYGLVFNGKPNHHNRFPDDCAWAAGMAKIGASTVVAHDSLSAYLSRFMIGSSGRSWDQVPQPDDHWSQFVVRCLEKAINWRYPLQRLGLRQQPRLRQALTFASAFHHIQEAANPEFWPYRYRSRSSRRNDWQSQFGDYFPRLPDIPNDTEKSLPPAGGISVLYTATFGSRPLDEITPLDNERRS